MLTEIINCRISRINFYNLCHIFMLCNLTRKSNEVLKNSTESRDSRNFYKLEKIYDAR